MPGRVCGIDFGTKRIGLAIGDPGGTIASPLVTVSVKGGLTEQARAVIVAVGEYDVCAWVVGLPLNMDDTEGPQAAATRKFGDELARVSGQAVHYCDERLSSLTADEHLRQADLTRKKHKRRRDQVAAQVILQTFLDERPTGR